MFRKLFRRILCLFSRKKVTVLCSQATKNSKRNSSKSKAPPKQLLELETKILLSILDHLPLQDLLQIHYVSYRFIPLQALACARRRHLTLQIGRHPELGYINQCGFAIPYVEEVLDSGGILHQFYCKNSVWSELEIEILDQKTSYWLIGTFPNIKSLSITQQGISPESLSNQADSSLNGILFVLNHWGSQLSTLKLWTLFDRTPGTSRAQTESNAVVLWRLVDCINMHLISLKSLTLICFGHILPEPYAQHRVLDFPCLSDQIEKFEFHSYDKPEVILSSLTRHAKQNENLKQISLGNTIQWGQQMDIFMGLDSETLVKCFQDVSVEYRSTNIHQLINFCVHFSSLHALRITVTNQPFSQLIYALSSLSELIYLRLNIEFPYYSSPFPQNPLTYIPQLKSVKILSLSLIIKSHHDLHKLSIDWIFPKLQALVLWNNGNQCTVCGYADSDDVPERQARECIRQLLQPLNQCKKLKKICTKRPQRWEWTLSDL